eukprot:5421121-Amphidinium_carterae.1
MAAIAGGVACSEWGSRPCYSLSSACGRVLAEQNLVAASRALRSARSQAAASSSLTELSKTALTDEISLKEAKAKRKYNVLQSDSGARASNRAFVIALDQQLRTCGVELKDFISACPLLPLAKGERREVEDGKIYIVSCNGKRTLEHDSTNAFPARTWIVVSDMGPKSWPALQALESMHLH